ASVPGDIDGDDLPDAWEYAFFPGDLTQLSGLSGADKDGDGVSDLDEYLGGSSPVNPGSKPDQPSSLIHRWSFTTGPDQLKDSVGSSDATIVNPEAPNGITFSDDAVTLAGGAKADSAAISLGTNLLGGKTTPVTIEVWATPNTAQSWAHVFN